MSLHNSQESVQNFNIQDYIQFLTPSPKNEANKYICPVCSGHNLSIAKNSPKYDCYNCGDTQGIAKVIIAEYAPKPEKKIRSKQYREWIYTDREGNPLVKVCRLDDGLGKRKIWQQHWENNQWINGLGNIPKEKIVIYNYQKIQQAIKTGERIFIVEGETCCDALNEIGIVATTNLGGSGKWTAQHSQDLIQALSITANTQKKEVNNSSKICHNQPQQTSNISNPEAKSQRINNSSTNSEDKTKTIPTVNHSDKEEQKITDSLTIDQNQVNTLLIVLSPDRDIKGIIHMEKIYQDFPSAKWLYPYPDSPLWNIKIPESQGLDILDWIEEMKAEKLTLQQIKAKILNSLENQPRKLKLESPTNPKVINHPLFTPITCQELRAKIEELCHENLSQVDVELEINGIATEYNRIPSEIRRIYQAIRRENEKQEQVAELLQTLPDIIKIPETNLDLYRILPTDLGASIYELAEAMPTAPEALFTALLPTWSFALGQKSKIIAKISSGYVQPAIIRTAIVAYSGERKSPVLKAATKVLQKMEANAYQEYRHNLEEYEQLLEIYDPKSGEPRPKKPTRKRYILTDVNFEGLIAVAKNNPSLLNIVDELAGYFKRMNKFSQGKGDDIERDLSLFNGGSLMKDRASEQVFVEDTTISAVGTIQWEKLKEIQKGYGQEDPAGIFSRWLFCAKKLPAGYLDLVNDSNQEPSLDSYNEVIIVALQSLPKTDYLFSKRAKKVFQEWQHQLVNQMQSQPIEAMRVAYPKFESYCLRLTLIFHCLWGIYDEILTYVSAETVEKAIYATNWFIAQYRYILAKNAQSNNIEGNALRLLTLLERKKELTIGQARKYDRTLYKLKENDLKILFEALCSTNVAEKISNTKTLKIKLI